jgi:hypothetical protein
MVHLERQRNIETYSKCLGCMVPVQEALSGRVERELRTISVRQRKVDVGVG